MLIINPPAIVASDFIDYPYFANIGALQHASVIAAEGFDVTVADSFSHTSSDTVALDDGSFLVGCGPEAMSELWRNATFDAVIVCVGVFHRPFERNDFLAGFFRDLRKTFVNTPIAAADAYFGGMHYVDYSGDDFIADYPEINVLIRYETEAAALHWLKNIGSSDGRGRVIIGEYPRNLDDLPFPAWDLINVENYMRFLTCFLKSTGRRTDFSDIMPVLPVVTSRGCRYNCSFCSGTDIAQTGSYRNVSNARLRRHIAALKKEYGIKGIAVLDGLANDTPDDFHEKLDIFKSADLKVSFLNGLRADRLEKSHIEMLSQVSPSLTVSAESASEKVRNGILNKRLELSSIDRVAAWCEEFSLPLSIHYMVGVPGETTADVNATLDHAHSTAAGHGANPLIQFCVPLPGSVIHKKLASDSGIISAAGTNYFGLFSGGRADEPADAHSARLKRMLRYFKMRMRESTPEKLIINLTYFCNNKCEMCAVGGRPRRNMSFERCSELLTDYRRRGVKLLDLDGGEPTLHPDLLDIIGAARDMGYDSINVTTNGRKLASRDLAARLLLSGITDLHISLYGPDAATHERITGVKGSFEETRKGIRNILRLKPGHVSFAANTVLTNSNYRMVSGLAEWLVDTGVAALDVQFPTPFGSAVKEHLPPVGEAVAEFEKAAGRFGDVMRFNLINLQPCMMPRGWPGAGADAEKYSRHMAFVDAPPQSLAVYLASKRRRGPECLNCEYYIICEGFYIFD